MNETKNKQTADRTAGTAAWLVLVVFTIATCWLNALAARMDNSHVAAHVAIPIIVLMAALFGESLAVSSLDRGTKWLCVSALVGVFCVVLWISYLGILTVSQDWFHDKPQAAVYCAAAIPDMMMLIAGTAILRFRMRRAKRAAGEAVDVPAAASPTRSALSQIRGNILQQVVNGTAPKPKVSELAEAAETFVEPSPNAPVEVPVPSGEPAVETVTEVMPPSVEPSPEPFVEVIAPSPKTSPKPPVKASVKVSKPSPKPSVDAELMPFMDAANDMVERSVVARKTAAELAQVIAAVEQGKTPNAIKSELGISPGTTAKVSAAWTEWRREHRLVAA